MVQRQQPGALDGAPHGNAPTVNIWVKNSVTEGISNAELDTGGDKVEIEMPDGTTQERDIKKRISVDAGMMQMEVR